MSGTLRDLIDALLGEQLVDLIGTRRTARMSLTISDTNPPVTVKATFTDAAGNEDMAGTIAFTSTGTSITVDDHGDGTASFAPAGIGDASLVATKTDPDGATLATPPFGITVTTSDATAGSIAVVA